MKGFVYLIRNGELYKIGSAKNLEDSFNILKPDEVIFTVETSNPEALEVRLLRRYKDKRIPDSGYFRLDESQILDCKKQMGPNSIIPSTLDDEFNITVKASITFFIISLVLVGFTNVKIFSTISISIAIASIPMFLLSILGNFGGYYSNDLSLFSTWINRLKALLMASFILSTSFTIYQISNLID